MPGEKPHRGGDELHDKEDMLLIRAKNSPNNPNSHGRTHPMIRGSPSMNKARLEIEHLLLRNPPPITQTPVLVRSLIPRLVAKVSTLRELVGRHPWCRLQIPRADLGITFPTSTDRVG